MNDARHAALTNATVLHLETGVIGRAAKLWEPGTYQPPVVPGEPAPARVDEEVLQLDTGDAFLARPGSYATLTGPEADVYAEVVHSLRELVTGAAVALALVPGADPARGLAVVRGALTSQLRALSRR